MDVAIECICPPKAGGEPRHDQDTVTLRETLDFRSVTAIRSNIGLLEDGTNISDVLAVLTEGYLVYGIESWTLVDDRNKPIPVSRVNVAEHILSRLEVASDIGDKADDLYGEKVVLPLLLRASNSSRPSPTGQTSRRAPGSTGSSDRRPKPSKPSSTTTTPTDDTVTTSSSLGGDSSSSQSSASAA